MAKRFLSSLKLVNLSSDPASGSAGELYYNQTSNIVKFYNGTSWTPMSQQGAVVQSGASYPASAQNGELFYNTSTGKTAIFFESVWKEFAYETELSSINGGSPETVSFASVIDGGSPTSNQFINNYDGGSP